MLVEVLLECALDTDFDGGALFSLAALCGDFVDVGGRAGGGVCLLEPLLQKGLQLAHVLEAELKGLEPAYRGLGEDVAVEGAEGEANVGLSEAELDAPLLELLGEGLEVVGGRGVLLAGAVVPVEGMTAV